MPGPMTEGERQGFLAGRHVGVVSVARGDGRPPHSTPVWYAYDPGGNISFFTGTQGRRSRKAELVWEAGVLSFVVQDRKSTRLNSSHANISYAVFCLKT